MNPGSIGYSYLIECYQLEALPLDLVVKIDSAIRGRSTTTIGGQLTLVMEPKYQPESTTVGHLQFALRYEGVNLHVLALLFRCKNENVSAEVIEALCGWIQGSPGSQYSRRSCFLYEWLTDKQLPIDDPVSARTSYLSAVDERQQFAARTGEKHSRFRINNNLPGSNAYCPLVRKTQFLQEMLEKNLHKLTDETLSRYDEVLLGRAAEWLYLKETQSSFELEREKPNPQKAQRFADILREADTHVPLTEDRLTELQRAVVDPRFHEFTWRNKQNWLGDDLGYRKRVEFVPAKPDDLNSLMSGLLAFAFRQQELNSIDPVVSAACIAFGFVYIHPFMDGNGRIHRYLIHDVLSKSGFTPKGIILPISAVILANIDRYVEALKHFSGPLNQRTEYYPDTPDIPSIGNDAVYFQYPDLTLQAEFLYYTLERTVTDDLVKEIEFLLGFDRAKKALKQWLDWPQQEVDLFIRVVRDNNGKLSKKKRKSHFSWMTEDEVLKAVQLVEQAYSQKSSEL